MLDPDRRTRARAAGRSSARPRLIDALPSALRIGFGVALASCTLTQGDFEPALKEPESLAPDESLAADRPSSIATRCAAPLECPSGFDCVDDACVAVACAGNEDGVACPVAVCIAGDCAVPQCSDGRQGGGETDVDCGGPCAPCGEGGSCGLGSDCETGACVEGACVAPSCSDAVVDQDETGPDCGGAICGGCAQGVACARDVDCTEGLFCAASGVCSPESCRDGVQGAAESGVDCGGGCEACPSGLGCAAVSDCQSGVCAPVGCATGVAACCQPAACDDGVQNGGESSVDCGGDACDRCALGSPCNVGSDCASNVCAADACRELCADGEQNGDESGIDCGGSELGCARCDDGQGCGSDGDCASGRCDGGVCTSCADGLENGGELGLDCGSGEAGCPECPRCTLDNSIELGAVGVIATMAADGCARITTFPGYAPTLLQSYEVGPFPVPIGWSQDCTGQTGAGVLESAFQQVPLTGLGVDCPVIFDLGGSNAPVQVRWF